MPRIKARVLAVKIDNGKMLAKIECNGKLPKVGEIVNLKWGSTRTLPQNALLWVYYSWLIDHAGMKDNGFFCPEALHSSLKAHFLSEKIMSKGEWKVIEEGSTTTLNKLEFSEFMEKIDLFICDFFEISTAEFWEEHRKNFQ